MGLKEALQKLPTIETKRLLLRKFKATDADGYRSCIENKKVFELWGSDMPKQTSESRIERNINEKRELTWAIAYKNTDRVIGDIAAHSFDGTRSSGKVIAELGYRISPDNWGQGIMTEAIGGVIGYLFDNTEIERIYATVMKENIGSKKALEKNNFIVEGLIRNGKLLDTICDYYILGILKSDYKNKIGKL